MAAALVAFHFPNQQPMNAKKIILIVLGIFVLVATGAIGFASRKKTKTTSSPPQGQSSKPSDQSSQTQQSNGKNCPKDINEPIFSVIPMELNDFRSFRPLGFINPPIHIFGAKHSNFTINLPGETVKSGLAVKFPSDAIVTQITTTYGDQGDTGYQITFYPCEQFKSYLFHLGAIADALAQDIATDQGKCQDFNFGNSKTKKCEKKTSLKVKAGDPVGTNDRFGGVDWGAVDYRVTNKFANPDRYDRDYPSYVSPVAYLTPELKEKMLDKLRSLDGSVKRTAEPIYGTIAQDVAGTAQGNWFIGDKSFKSEQDFSPFMALLHDYIDPNQPIFSMGNSVKNVKMGLYSFEVKNEGLINRNFKDIKPDGMLYCFDNFLTGQSVGKLNLTKADGLILMEMPDAKTLKIEFETGSCSNAHQLTSMATTFER